MRASEPCVSTLDELGELIRDLDGLENRDDLIASLVTIVSDPELRVKLRFCWFVLSTLVCAFGAHAQDPFKGTGFFIGQATPRKSQPRYEAFVRQVQQAE